VLSDSERQSASGRHLVLARQGGGAPFPHVLHVYRRLLIAWSLDRDNVYDILVSMYGLPVNLTRVSSAISGHRLFSVIQSIIL
jgi:hypothetical protein